MTNSLAIEEKTYSITSDGFEVDLFRRIQCMIEA